MNWARTALGATLPWLVASLALGGVLDDDAASFIQVRSEDPPADLRSLLGEAKESSTVNAQADVLDESHQVPDMELLAARHPDQAQELKKSFDSEEEARKIIRQAMLAEEKGATEAIDAMGGATTAEQQKAPDVTFEPESDAEWEYADDIADLDEEERRQAALEERETEEMEMKELLKLAPTAPTPAHRGLTDAEARQWEQDANVIVNKLPDGRTAIGVYPPPAGSNPYYHTGVTIPATSATTRVRSDTHQKILPPLPKMAWQEALQRQDAQVAALRATRDSAMKKAKSSGTLTETGRADLLAVVREAEHARNVQGLTSIAILGTVVGVRGGLNMLKTTRHRRFKDRKLELDQEEWEARHQIALTKSRGLWPTEPELQSLERVKQKRKMMKWQKQVAFMLPRAADLTFYGVCNVAKFLHEEPWIQPQCKFPKKEDDT